MVAKVAGGVIIAFVVFYLVVSPDQAAHIAEGTWHLIQRIADGIKKLVDDLAT